MEDNKLWFYNYNCKPHWFLYYCSYIFSWLWTAQFCEKRLRTSKLCDYGSEHQSFGSKLELDILNYGFKPPSILFTLQLGSSILNYGSKPPSILNYGSEPLSILNYGCEPLSILNYGSEPLSILNYGSEVRTSKCHKIKLRISSFSEL